MKPTFILDDRLGKDSKTVTGWVNHPGEFGQRFEFKASSRKDALWELNRYLGKVGIDDIELITDYRSQWQTNL